MRVDAAGGPPRQPPSLNLFRRHGYRQFKEVLDYYEDHMTALRFEKRLVPNSNSIWSRSLLPADPRFHLRSSGADDGHEGAGPDTRTGSQVGTAAVARGHHHLHDRRPRRLRPYGLALSSYRRGFDLEIHVNEDGVFLVDSVRSPEKRK